jgi:hypothetical protein
MVTACSSVPGTFRVLSLLLDVVVMVVSHASTHGPRGRGAGVLTLVDHLLVLFGKSS